MRGLTLFRPLVSNYKRAPVSTGQIRHYGGSRDGGGSPVDLLLIAGLGIGGAIYTANYLYEAIQDLSLDNANKESSGPKIK